MDEKDVSEIEHTLTPEEAGPSIVHQTVNLDDSRDSAEVLKSKPELSSGALSQASQNHPLTVDCPLSTRCRLLKFC